VSKVERYEAAARKWTATVDAAVDADEEVEEARELLAQRTDLADMGSKVIRALEKAHALRLRVVAPDDASVISNRCLLAQVQQYCGLVDESIKTVEDAIELCHTLRRSIAEHQLSSPMNPEEIPDERDSMLTNPKDEPASTHVDLDGDEKAYLRELHHTQVTGWLQYLYRTLGENYLMLDKHDDAIQALILGINALPLTQYDSLAFSTAAAMHTMVAQTHQLKGTFDEAREHFTEALGYASRVEDALSRKKTLKEDQQQMLESATAQLAEIYAQLGSLVMRQGDHAEARSYYKLALKPIKKVHGAASVQGILYAHIS
jgi:tetratricopeptide (TPR) repeat protein